MKILKIRSALLVSVAALAALGVTSCNEKKFKVEGTIAGAKDSTLYFENIGLNGVSVLDSTKLSDDGSFDFDVKAAEAPEFYRLRIAGQIINLSADSTETVTVKAEYPGMATNYEVSGSDNCSKIKELALKQMQLQAQVNAIVAAPNLGIDAVSDSVRRVLETYKQDIKINYIYKEPMKAYAYFALFQTVVLGQSQSLIFNPRSVEDDVKAFAAVATSWDAFHPNAERGKNLHNIAIEGMKNIRIVRNRQAQAIDASLVNTTGVIDIALPDNKGNIQHLASLSGKVVLLDFHAFTSENSIKRIMMLRELYNKYHAQGFEIFQVSVDGDEHFWKTQTAALPWISVHVDQNSADVLNTYNVQSIPTFFLLDKNTNVVKRDAQVKDIDAEIKALL